MFHPLMCMDWCVILYTWVPEHPTRPGVGSGTPDTSGCGFRNRILIIVEHTDKRPGNIDRTKRYAENRFQEGSGVHGEGQAVSRGGWDGDEGDCPGNACICSPATHALPLLWVEIERPCLRIVKNLCNTSTRSQPPEALGSLQQLILKRSKRCMQRIESGKFRSGMLIPCSLLQHTRHLPLACSCVRMLCLYGVLSALVWHPTSGHW